MKLLEQNRILQAVLPFRARWPIDRAVLFITSFNETLFEVSGRRCLESFRALNPEYRLCAYIEADAPERLTQLDQSVRRFGAETVDLNSLGVLEEFLAIARDVIPCELGGTAPTELFPGEGPASGDIWFRKHMYRWFRKIVALEHAAREFDDVLIWMDCDCYAKASLPRRILERGFGSSGIFHMKGTREFTETGFVGYDLQREGVRTLIEDMMRHYIQRQFVEHRRWDDCYTFDLIRARYPSALCRDIGGRAREFGHILCSTLLAPYIEHDKGLHSRKTGLMQ